MAELNFKQITDKLNDEFTGGVRKLIFADGTAAIPEYFAQYAQNLEEVVIPASVASIGRNAFESCIALKGIDLPDAVSEISISMLASCTSLTNIRLSENIAAVRDYAFAGSGLTSLTLPEGIKTLGKGYGYAKYYTEPASHVYSMWTVTHNGRVGDGSKTKAACITCKSPQYSNLVDMEGTEVHARPFNDVVGEIDENISCASCHANTPMKDGKVYLEVDRAEWIRSMGDDAGNTIEGEVCGQCHCDYSMAPGTSIPTSPYDNGRTDMVPEKALQWYDDHNYVDWTYASTGAKMLAIRHAEYEFIYGGDNDILPMGSHMQNLGYDCGDCHMATTTAEDGTVYASHEWISPLDNKELIDRDCSSCHADIVAEVRAIQNEIDPATTVLGQRCEQYIKNLETKVATEQDDAANPGTKVLKLDEALAASNGIDAATLERLQWIQRASCYYWNLAAAENSEGAHNPTYYRYCLDKGNELLDEGDKLLGMSSAA